jgi:phosphate transport system permease protein
MESARIDLRRAEDKGGDLVPIRARIAALEKEYAALRERAEAVLAEAGKGGLESRDGAGRSVVSPSLTLVRAWLPNRMGLGERFGLMMSRVREFVFDEPREANTEGGLFPAMFGTLVMTVFMSLLVTPFGVIAAIYLREYAAQGPVLRAVRISVNNLAGVPSIVFGVFGLGFFVYVLGGSVDRLFFADQLKYNNNTPVFGTGGLLWCSLTLALMTLPVVIVATEEALAAVPRGMREASLAAGASKWQTVRHILLPASAPGILTGIILAMARGAGEVAPLMLVGVVKLAPTLPFDGTAPFLHLDRKFMHLGFHVYDLGFQSPDSDAARPMVFATTLLLILLVVALNLGAIWIRNRLRRRFRGAAF